MCNKVLAVQNGFRLLCWLLHGTRRNRPTVPSTAAIQVLNMKEKMMEHLWTSEAVPFCGDNGQTVHSRHFKEWL